MVHFAVPPVGRDQLTLFTEKLDDIIDDDHPVRLLDDILEKIDWTAWENSYVLTRGQPPIHPRYLAGAILYGIMKRIRSSRALEEAIQIRIDFRWLVHGMTIDHSTICRFREKSKGLIKDLFVQIAMVARTIGYVHLETLGFDGTRLRASNRRTGSRTPEELKILRNELEKQFEELEKQIAQADKEENQQSGQPIRARLTKDLKDVARRRAQVDAALAEVDRLTNANQKVPNRIPITDPQSRIMPNKEGGFAPNYTPTSLVDIDSGMVVATEVISGLDEDKYMMPLVNEVTKNFGLEESPLELLADGMMGTGENLAQCHALAIELYSPSEIDMESDNPALRPDLTQPIPAEDIPKLQTIETKHRDGTTTTQFHKNAFVYDEENDCYRCPNGKALEYSHTTSETENGRKRIRMRYQADPADCGGCPLKQFCVKGQGSHRTVNHEQHEKLRIAHAKKMATDEGKKIYSRRRHAVERVFATTKQQFGARCFLTRGLAQVQCEWDWLISAFNLHRLMTLVGKVGPPKPSKRIVALPRPPFP